MLRDILNTFWTKIASAILTLCILILTTQYLGADGRGLVSLINSSVGIIALFTGFVGGPALIYLASKKPTQYLLLPAYGWIVIVSLLGTIVVWFFQVVPIVYIIPIAILSVAFSIYLANNYVLVGKQVIRTNNLIYLFQWGVNFLTLGFLFIFLNNPSVESAVIALFLSYFFGLALTWYELTKITKRIPFDSNEQINALKSLVSFSLFAQAATVMWYTNYRLGIFGLNIFSGLYNVGIYSVAVNIAEFILLASQSIALVGYSRISNTENREYARNITIKLTKFGFIVTICICIFLLLMPASVYGMVFGGDFTSVPGILLTMSPGIVAFGTSVIVFNYFSGVGKNKINAIATFIGLFSNGILCSVMIPLYGPYGAGITASIGFILMSGMLFFMFLRDTHTRFGEFFIRKTDIVYLFTTIRNFTDLQKVR